MTKPNEKGNIFGTPKQLEAMRSNFKPACWIVLTSAIIAVVVISCSNESPYRVKPPVVKEVVK